MQLSDAWMIYEADKQIEGYSPYTLRSYKLQAKMLIEFLKDIQMEEVTIDQLKSYLAKDAGRLKPSSLGHRVRFIRSLFRWALDEGIIPRNPSAKLKEPKQGNRVPKAMVEEDIEALREACKSAREHALIEFLYSTGCRIGELVKLNRNSIEWENRSLIVRGKGDKEREVYFSSKCAIWLKRYLNSRKDTDFALFATEHNPYRRLSIEQIRWLLKRIAERAGVQTSVYPHKLRHTYATHLLNNGAPIEVIQSLLGHSKTQTTLLYAHLSGARRQEQYRRYF